MDRGPESPEIYLPDQHLFFRIAILKMKFAAAIICLFAGVALGTPFEPRAPACICCMNERPSCDEGTVNTGGPGCWGECISI
ncbi:uncharacterized protein MAM_07218 [Metarhizium album ARSEF 1941]|uniref:Uncharacterized protein n=1 Tax=Metarhizium album (strain ARSEF 1941) TaxID=1081103 RepID=A0A0B2WG69_METAS|nr:uncharacterized protein MAM_07218 [Metarhizium album ARSEF 1941]KHN94991.1 hypothetical protein MAM_07218 [Metarhizium album ARSEF 1941]